MMPSIDSRINFMTKLKNTLQIIDKKCIYDTFREIKKLGQGFFGAVTLEEYNHFNFAMKKMDIGKSFEQKNIIDVNYNEYVILKEYINPLIYKKICPNLPLLYYDFECEDCGELKLSSTKKIVKKCKLLCTELANGTLNDYLSDNNPSIDELYSCIFQLSSAIHALQKYYQIGHGDIKAANILYYKIKKGGYWKYTINNKNYYVPNYGYLFVLNDFGISEFYFNKINNKIKGTRLGYIRNNKIKPFNTIRQVYGLSDSEIKFSNGTYISRSILSNPERVFEKIDQNIKNELLKFEIDENNYFDKPLIIPPFEFFNDIQGLIRSFLGGVYTARAFEKYPPILPKIVKNENFESVLEKYHSYLLAYNNRDELPIEGYFYLAHLFIEDLFQDKYFNIPLNDEIIEEYII